MSIFMVENQHAADGDTSLRNVGSHTVPEDGDMRTSAAVMLSGPLLLPLSPDRHPQHDIRQELRWLMIFQLFFCPQSQLSCNMGALSEPCGVYFPPNKA